jgi:hypothetical protein
MQILCIGNHCRRGTTGIAVIGNDVYVSGVNNQRPDYWRNGNRNLPDAAPGCTTSGILW